MNKTLLLALSLVLFPLVGKTDDVPVEAPKAKSDVSVDDELSHKRMNYQINSRYKAGEYLIYQCEFEYYACVDADANQKCIDDRQKGKDKKHDVYTCAPLKKFATKKACLVSNYEVVEAIAKKRFCYPK